MQYVSMFVSILPGYQVGKEGKNSSESYGLAVEHLAHDRKVVGLIPMLDGNGVKAMPGSIPAPNPGSYNN